MTYENFAYLYDGLMEDVPYDKWVTFINRQVEVYKPSGKKMLDLACGTGQLSILLAEQDFKITGVDLSADMLSVAREKAEKNGHSLFLVEQDMTQLEGLGEFDIIGIFCDSLNYLQTEQDVIHTFQGVYKHLKKDGLFMFDIHSIYKMSQLFINQTYAYNGEEISYIWQCFEGEQPYSVEHELTFFKLDDESGKYNRYDELHFQRTFQLSHYERWLNESGFEILSITADFHDAKPGDKSERIFFTARKK
jgi:ubiquinone/menaquinone biosynthesis C-methylase UbiE